MRTKVVFELLILVLLSGCASADWTYVSSCGTIHNDTRLTADINTSGTCFTFAAGNAKLDCQNHIISGNSSHHSADGIAVDGFNNVTIVNCDVRNFAYGIVISNINRFTLANNSVQGGFYNALFFSYATNGVIQNNRALLNNIGQPVMALNYGGNNLIVDNLFYNNTGSEQIRMEGNTSHNTIVHNTLVYGGTGFSDAGSSYNNISDNAVCEHSTYDFSDFSGFPQTNFGRDNSCAATSNWNDTGISGCTYTCEGITQCGEIYHSVELQTDLISNGTCITLNLNPNGITVDCGGHIILGNGSGTGIYVPVNNASIKNCDVRNFTEGIFLNNSINSTVSDNTLRSNLEYPLYLTSASRSEISGNRLFNNQRGIVLDDSTDNIVHDNLAAYNSNNQIRVWYESVRNVINHNVLLDGSGNGILMNEGANNNYTNNLACGNSGGDIWVMTANITNVGYQNTCSTPHMWDDVGATGCTNPCSAYAYAINCGNISQNTILAVDASANGTCFTITADNVTLDCAGHKITGNNATSSYGVYIAKNNVAVKNCEITNFSSGTYMTSVTGGLIYNNTAHHNGGSPLAGGIYTFNSKWVNITHNTAYSQYRGIRIYSPPNTTYIEDNLVHNNYDGIEVDGTNSLNTQITRNNASGNSIGITLTSAGSSNFTAAYNTFCGNTIYDTENISNPLTSSASNNTCDTALNWFDNTVSPAGCTFACNGTAIRGCATLTRNTTLARDVNATYSCIRIDQDDVTFNCQNNTLNGIATGIGIFVTGSNDHIRNCIINNFSTGIQFNGAISGSSLETSTVKNNLNNGVYLSGTSLGVTVTGNTLLSNKWHGLQAIQWADNNVISGNNAFLNWWSGIALNTVGNTVLENNASYNVFHGIHIGSNNTIISNELRYNNDTGIYIDGGAFNNITGNTVVGNIKNGVLMRSNASGNVLRSNVFCLNVIRDVNNSIPTLNSGSSNTCDTYYGWNDAGYTGCKYPCASSTSQTERLYTGWNLLSLYINA
ncbi:Right handed beta helix region [uncultured archaeon]|nr:Right handed beta helix region [uncultured archaeon]